MTATTAESIAPWLEDADLDGGLILKLAASAERAAADLTAEGGTIAIGVEPGNGHRYLFVLAHLAEEWLPGDLLVALPDFHVSALMSSTGFHVPGYINEKMRLGQQHSTVVAAFLTLLGDLLRRP